ncbi:fatty acyl-CoA reductase wat-like [Culicoides brevitarsis]|uniref:fatty acyl-CoA reductase wat-like n=1 Tax=Culicoides brevitarsis TaxID=469753 RepID=UPI00307C1159
MESSVVEFYQNKSVFLTGFTGLLGHIITEKLLRCCDLKAIYVLVRDKKGKSWQNRLDEVFEDPLFERLHKEKPDFKKRVIGIVGDCGVLDLGLNSNDINTIKEKVNVIIHAAATVRFDETLKKALFMNVKATKTLLDIAKEMRNLDAFIHVSTAYANCNQRGDINEAFYKPKYSATNMLKLLEILDEKAFNDLTADMIKGFPNTYAFSKHIAEDLVQSYNGQLPIVVFRPTFVMPTFREPVSGWTNNYYGPVGLMYGISLGVVHVYRLKPDNYAELVPVDMVVSCLLSTAWDIARSNYGSIQIYNFAPSNKNPLLWRRFIDETLSNGKLIPASKAYWYYAFETVENKHLFALLHFLYHTLPGRIVDLFLGFSNTKLRLSRVYASVEKLDSSMQFFSFNNWNFENTNVMKLWKKLSPVDKEMFFFDMENFDWSAFCKDSTYGFRRYIAKDDPSTIPFALKRQKVLKITHYVVTYSIKGLALYLLILLFSWIFNVFKYFMFN